MPSDPPGKNDFAPDGGDVEAEYERLKRTPGHDDNCGIRLGQPCWEIDGPAGFPELFEALRGWLPDDAILYFEGGSPDSEIREFMANHSISAPVLVRRGTLWPKPLVFHVPATADALSELAQIMDHHAEPELAVHFHVYRDTSVLLEWHDAFSQPMSLNSALPEEQVKALADRFGTRYRMDSSDPTRG